jgi:CO/xanthine dehydrogenase FAD-binding subunit
VLAGGTDFYTGYVGRPVKQPVLDITALPELRGVREDAGGWRIGALTTWSDMLAQPLPAVFDGLKLAAREVGGRQVQNAGTIAGNICNASPAADGVPALLALDAQVELSALAEVRRVPLTQFILGNRRTQRRPDELVTGVLIPSWGAGTRTAFLKLGARRYLVISIAMVAATLEIGIEGKVTRAAVAVGACSEVAQRIPRLEARLAGQPLSSALCDLLHPQDLSVLGPLSDVRGTAEFRRDAVATLIRRALMELAGE